MCAAWKKDFGLDVDLLVQRLASLSKTRRVYDRYDLSADGYLATLFNAIEFRCDVPLYIRRELLIIAFRDWREKGGLTKLGLINTISKTENKYLEAEPVRYHLLTSISVRYDQKIRFTKIDDCWIYFHRGRPVKYNLEKYQANAEQYDVYKQEPHNCTWVVVSVTDRSQSAAAYKALDALGLLLGIWNLWERYRRLSISLGGRPKPIGKILLGPLHTLYYPNGKPAAEFIVYQQNYYGRLWSHQIRNLERLYDDTKWTIGRIRKNRNPDRLKEWFRRYASSVQLQNHESAFLKLWSLLEELTFTRAGQGLKKATRRTAFMYRTPDVHREVLKNLVTARNIHVHSESYDFWETTRLQLTKMYVDELLNFHLEKGRQYKDSELEQFLDAPFSLGDIQQRIDMLRDAKNFRKPK
jgi:hypothetical protein